MEDRMGGWIDGWLRTEGPCRSVQGGHKAITFSRDITYSHHYHGNQRSPELWSSGAQEPPPPPPGVQAITGRHLKSHKSAVLKSNIEHSF